MSCDFDKVTAAGRAYSVTSLTVLRSFLTEQLAPIAEEARLTGHFHLVQNLPAPQMI